MNAKILISSICIFLASCLAFYFYAEWQKQRFDAALPVPPPLHGGNDTFGFSDKQHAESANHGQAPSNGDFPRNAVIEIHLVCRYLFSQHYRLAFAHIQRRTDACFRHQVGEPPSRNVKQFRGAACANVTLPEQFQHISCLCFLFRSPFVLQDAFGNREREADFNFGGCAHLNYLVLRITFEMPNAFR